MNIRLLHRKIAPVLFLPLLLSALTGLSYRIGRTWFGLSGEFGNMMMTLHEGRYLGAPLVPVYILLVGLGLLGLMITGVSLVVERLKRPSRAKKQRLNHRRVHALIAPICFLPLGMSAITGILYRLGKNWFSLSPEQSTLLLNLHQGTFLGQSGRPFYILFIGLGLLGLLGTGIQMTGIFRRRVGSSF